MMKKMTCLIVGAVAMVSAAAADTQSVVSVVTQTNAPSAEVTILKAQLDVIRDYDARLLSTVHWALGVLVTVFFILLGYNWIVNFRQYQKDKEDVENALKEGLEAVKQAMAIEIQKELPKISSEAQAAGQAGIKSLRQEVEREFARIKLKELIDEARMWRAQKVFANSIRYTCKAILIICDSGPEYLLSDQLTLLRGDISSISGNALDPGRASEVLYAITKLPPTYAIEVEALTKLVAEKRSQS